MRECLNARMRECGIGTDSNILALWQKQPAFFFIQAFSLMRECLNARMRECGIGTDSNILALWQKQPVFFFIQAFKHSCILAFSHYIKVNDKINIFILLSETKLISNPDLSSSFVNSLTGYT